MNADTYRTPDQTGRTWLITGATHGIGVEAARFAAAAGARVIITARDMHLGNRIASEVGAARVIELDLADLASVGRAAEALDESVDVLANNAGTAASSRRETADGFEFDLGVNFLGPFAFTNLIIDRVTSRIVITGSDAYRAGTVDLADPNYEHRKWSVMNAYSTSKLYDMLWGLELGRRVESRGIEVQLVHPGFVASNLLNVSKNATINRMLGAISKVVAKSPAEGAENIMMAATAVIPPLSYVGPVRGGPGLLSRTAKATDGDQARLLWKFAAEQTGTDLPPKDETTD